MPYLCGNACKACAPSAKKLELQRPRSTPSCLLPDQPSVSPGSLSLLDDRGPLAGCSARARPRVPRPSTDPPSICCDGGVPARSPTGRGFGHHGAPFSFWFWWPTHSFTSSLKLGWAKHSFSFNGKVYFFFLRSCEENFTTARSRQGRRRSLV